MTDGAKDDYYKAFRALSRTVTIDLGAVCSVTGYEAAFYSTSSSGVYVPRCISMAVSQNGEQYMTVSQAARDYSIFGTPNRTSTLGDTLASPAAARYVRIEFPVDVFCYISEIEVYGYETPQGNEQPFRADEPTAYPNALYEKIRRRNRRRRRHHQNLQRLLRARPNAGRQHGGRAAPLRRVPRRGRQHTGHVVRRVRLRPPAMATTPPADGWSKRTASPAR